MKKPDRERININNMVLETNNVRGMYGIMKVITITLLLKIKDEPFEKKDLIPYCNISCQAISNNITRLCDLGFLIKIESNNNNNGNGVKYKINGDRIESICNTILN